MPVLLPVAVRMERVGSEDTNSKLTEDTDLPHAGHSTVVFLGGWVQ